MLCCSHVLVGSGVKTIVGIILDGLHVYGGPGVKTIKNNLSLFRCVWWSRGEDY